MTFLNDLAWPLLLWSGLAAYVLSTWLLMLLRKLGATRYLPRAYWSCVLTAGVGDVALVFAGLIRFLAMIAVFPIIYALLFQRMAGALVLPGLIVGAGHGLLAALILPLAARRCPGALPPGFMGWKLGRLTPLVMLFVHAIYGALLGYVYVLAA